MESLKAYLNAISPLQEHTWQAIQPHFSYSALPKGAYYIQEGQIAKEFALLQKGVVRAFHRNRDGSEYNKRFFTCPSMIGSYASLITGTPSLFTQQALTDCQILKADYATISSLYLIYPDLERLARKFAENYFVENEKKEVEIVVLNADERYLQFQKDYPGLEQQISQYHIASFLGITPTQLSRIRRKLLS
ncbi:Crp/Fnr family transcriptional regulator [Cytophagaceae bacterium YF14B1]|uniref:Crp/Fnr family transcriptional regulator n=1 Tax=Xanthocytophaga flava TaxID=3048013 RepID=A0AAE3QRK0_9BACT|nr:Crp/Fnr family transcriptional regulator [Xanthocytophaga flavus]MDJ1481915.1 Crp/Fnr family transcriptional regulator [Xanthocytophaga flavus]